MVNSEAAAPVWRILGREGLPYRHPIGNDMPYLRRSIVCLIGFLPIFRPLWGSKLFGLRVRSTNVTFISNRQY